MEMKHVVVMIREPSIRKLLEDALAREGVRCQAAASPAQCLAALEAVPVQAAFIDGDMSGVNDEFLRSAASVQPCLAMAVFVDRAALESVRRRTPVVRVDYLAKPFTLDAVRSILAKAAGHRAHAEQPAAELRPEAPSHPAALHPAALHPAALPPAVLPGADAPLPDLSTMPRGRIIARSPAMREVLAMAAKAATTDAPVLIEGEPGTGKSLVRRRRSIIQPPQRGPAGACGLRGPARVGTGRKAVWPVQGRSRPRPAWPLASWNRPIAARSSSMACAGCPYGAGQIIGRLAQRRHLAQRRTGKPLDLRIIASASSDVTEAIAQRRFDSALYYHLNVVRLCIPPLRTRPQDVKALADHFLTTLAVGTHHGRPCRLSNEASQALLQYDWPGNAPQLSSVLANAMVLADGEEIGVRVPSAVGWEPCPARPIPRPILAALGGQFERHGAIDHSGSGVALPRQQGGRGTLPALHRRTLYRLLRDRSPAKEEVAEQ